MRVTLIFLMFFSVSYAQDFGVHGHVYPIEEPCLLTYIQEKLFKMQSDGELVLRQEALKNAVSHRLQNPASVPGLISTQKPRSFYYDPSITLPRDLKNQNGVLIHGKGTRVNALSYRSLSRKLLFIQGENADHLAFAQKLKGLKVILVSGNPFQTHELLKEPVYFDQGGVLVKKLGINQVPALVSQEGMRLKIQEIQL